MWKEGRFDLPDLNGLNRSLSEMGSCHKACGFVVTLWAHLWMDHMWGIAREWGTVSAFNAFDGEGKHQSLKSEIRKRSFKGGRKKRGPAYEGQGEHIDNLDWGLHANGFSVRQPA